MEPNLGAAPVSRSGRLWWLWLLGLVVVVAAGTAVFLSAAVVKKPAGDTAGSSILPALTLNGSRLTLEGANPSTVDLEPIVRQLARQQSSPSPESTANGLVAVTSGGGLVMVGSGTVIDPYRLGLQACASGKVLTSQGGGSWGCATTAGVGGGVVYSAGSGILISGSLISNTGILSLAAGSGLSASGGQTPTLSFAAGTASGQIWQWNGSQWVLAVLPSAGVSSMGALDGQPKNANGAAIVGSTLYLQSADSANPGLITAGSQALAGSKTLTGALTVTNSALFQNTTNSTSAFVVKNAAGTSVLTVDTTNQWVGIGTSTMSAGAKLEVVGSMASPGISGQSITSYRDLAAYSGPSGNSTGTMEIVMPKGWSNNMMQIVIRGYDYSSFTGAWTVTVGGYNYIGGAWYNYSARIDGKAPFSQVRLGYNGTNVVILLGNTTTVWSYPKVVVADFIATSDASGWGSGWSISQITSETGLTSIVAPTVNQTAYTNQTFLQGGNSFGATAVLGTNDANALQFETNGQTRLTLDAVGNLGIGTTAPAALLDVSGSASIRGALTVTNSALFQNTTNSTSAFVVKNAAGSNLFTIDSLNSRLGLNLGGSNLPSVTFDMVGALRLAGSVSDTTSFVTPAAASTPTKINIPLYDPGYSGQVLALGLPSTTGVTSRAITLFDARTVAHQPTLAVLNPAESDGVGFSWDGSNTVAGIKTIGTADITVNNALKVFKAGGSVSVGNVGLSTTYTLNVSSPSTTLGGIWIRLQGNPEKFFKVDTSVRPTSDVFNISSAGTVWMSPLSDTATNPALRIRDSSGNYTALDVDTQYGALAINQNVSTTGAAALDVINGFGSTTQITFRAKAVASQTADVFQIVNSGGLTVASISPAGDLTVQNGTISNALTVYRIISNGVAPTVAAGAAAGTGATVSVVGNNISGTITVTTGTSPTAGTLVTLTFALPYTTAPRVTLEAGNASAAGLTRYVTPTTTNFGLNSSAVPAASTTYTFYYQVIQ